MKVFIMKIKFNNIIFLDSVLKCQSGMQKAISKVFVVLLVCLLWFGIFQYLAYKEELHKKNASFEQMIFFVEISTSACSLSGGEKLSFQFGGKSS